MKNIKSKKTSNHGLRGFLFIVCAITAMAFAGCGGDGTPNNGDGDITVTFNLGDAPGTNPLSITIKNNTSMGGKCPKDPTWTDHEFLGWYNGAAEYTRTTVINSDSSTFPLTAKWKEEGEYQVDYAESPPIHPGNDIYEVTGGGIYERKVNEVFNVNGLNSFVGEGDGVLTADWYRTTSVSDYAASVQDKGDPKGQLIITQPALDYQPHKISISFSWKEEAAGTYYYYLIVTNYNEHATVNKYGRTITQNYLTVTVTE